MTAALSKVAKEKVTMHTQHTASPTSVLSTGGQGPPQSQATDSATLERLNSMLEKVLLQRPVQSGPTR